MTLNNLAVITQDIYSTRESFAAVLTDQNISFEKEAGFAIQVLQNNEYTLKAAMNDRQAVVNAVNNVAAIGISLNPAKKQAYLVPRKNKIYLEISYMGLIDLAVSTGSIKWAQAALVHENDGFALNGYDAPPTHTFNPFFDAARRAHRRVCRGQDRRRRLPDAHHEHRRRVRHPRPLRGLEGWQ